MKTQDEHHKDLVALIDSDPKYQKGGKLRFVVENMGEDMGIDDDFTRGVDDGVGVWNMSDNQE